MKHRVRGHLYPSGAALELLHADITTLKVDAIVNAANEHLRHGGGVAGIISAKGGASIQQESSHWVQEHGLVKHNAPALTGAGNLPCKYIIHAVGPIWGEGDEDKKLEDAILGSLLLAEKLSLKSLAIPPISTGIFGFPKERAAGIFFNIISQFFQEHPSSSLRTVGVTIIDTPTLNIFLAIFDRWFTTTGNSPS
ncbi:MAG: macro domain-containing protein [Anaerolineaceae bacterium]|nr:macro domain-containing protein [Anaerolineaceae bacterium]